MNSESILLREIVLFFSPLVSRRYHPIAVTLRPSSVGDIGLLFSSRSLSTQSEVDHFARVLDTGVNSIRATGPDRMARVVSHVRPSASVAMIL